jgi:hypothetical protein
VGRWKENLSVRRKNARAKFIAYKRVRWGRDSL